MHRKLSYLVERNGIKVWLVQCAEPLPTDIIIEKRCMLVADEGKVPSTQLPAFIDDVLEFPSLSSFPATGESGKIYVALDTNKTYRWSGSTYVEISPSIALGETESTAYRGDRGKIAYDHTSRVDNPHNVTKAQLGLQYVDNTRDEDKPVSGPQQDAIDAVDSKIDTHLIDTSNPHSVTKAQVGLSNVDNTADADKPVSVPQQTAIDNAVAAEASARSSADTAIHNKFGTKYVLSNGVDKANAYSWTLWSDGTFDFYLNFQVVSGQTWYTIPLPWPVAYANYHVEATFDDMGTSYLWAYVLHLAGRTTTGFNFFVSSQGGGPTATPQIMFHVHGYYQ